MTLAAATIKSSASAAIVARKFDWLMTAFSAWFVAGLLVDAWAHFHLTSSLETFFTPWHALLYSGFLSCATLLVTTAVANRQPGTAFWQCLPSGYQASLLGVVIFAFGGVADMCWHVFFGIEKDIATQFSPSHLLLAVGMLLIVSGPIRSTAARINSYPATVQGLLPALLAIAFVLSIMMVFTKALQPTYIPWGAGDWRPDASHLLPPLLQTMIALQEALGMATFVIASGMIVAVVLVALRAKLLPPGSLTLILGVTTTLFGSAFMPMGVLTGIAADLLLLKTRPSRTRLPAVRLLAFTVPAVFCALLQLETYLRRGGIWWPAHLVVGSIVLSGLIGLMMSYLVFEPPPLPVITKESG